MESLRKRSFLTSTGVKILLSDLSTEHKVLVTGASGWLGRETICHLTQILDPNNFPKLVLSGKTTRTINLHGSKHLITALDELIPNENYDLIIHFAFVTQEKLNTIGVKDYITENLHLNERIQSLSESAGKCKTLIISSGAAEMYGGHESGSSSKAVYGSLKKELEDRFLNSESLILRLWTISGHHLGENPNYALSEFIGRATKDEPIAIRENVSRTYVAAPDILHAAVNYLLNGGSGIVNSGGDFTTLGDLAKTVVGITNSSSTIVAPLFSPNHQGNYVSPNSEIPTAFWGQRKSLNEQVRETISGRTVIQSGQSAV